MATKRVTMAWVNDAAIAVEPRETLLAAALRSGISFPNACRVGGCATCKCRLVAGKVQELTTTEAVLTDDELERGFILACQSVPTSDDVRVEVELPRRVSGRIVAQERLTRDIVLLRAKLDVPLDHRAGQFASVRLARLPEVARSYSFATPAGPENVVELFVREVPGGRLSTLIASADLVGEEVHFEGPSGDLWLRPSTAPLLLVAGGSGLAPLLALLREAAASRVARDATLLFGARTRADLYMLEAIADLQRAWNGRLDFVPVLSDEDPASGWSGERGLVTTHAAERATPAMHAYLCGPPAMIDAAVPLLVARGVQHESIRADRFVTASHPLDAAVVAGPLDHAKFFLFHAVGLFSFVALVAGGRTVTAGLLAVVTTYIVGDAIGGDDTSTPAITHPRLLTIQLWLALPLLALIVFAGVWSVSPGDPLGFGALVHTVTGFDALAARAATAFGGHVSGGILAGLMIGMIGTIPAHELTHRTRDRVSLAIGRWLLAFSFDTSFAIEHVYGHHRYVATRHDPATAPRGRNVYAHILSSTFRGNVSAWRIERGRLRRKNQATLSWHNAVLRGYLASALLVLVAWSLGGLAGASFFVVSGLWGKALLEIVNYMEHYGIVRDPASPVEPRHSWNTNRRVSSWTMFNLTRHSHHHAEGEVPYHDLRPYRDAPEMIGGYLTTIVLALVPPLWHHLMGPRLEAWDRDHASPAERSLVDEATPR